ncbi:hypothetical protein SAMN04487985_101111 [Aerococcus urinaehominis]|nr:hypothetical protein [Aerococcus urinaehominis]SDL80482.1 hypothetical protein SAMN04487985_101111 [Aerococcus urinaehominis]
MIKLKKLGLVTASLCLLVACGQGSSGDDQASQANQSSSEVASEQKDQASQGGELADFQAYMDQLGSGQKVDFDQALAETQAAIDKNLTLENGQIDSLVSAEMQGAKTQNFTKIDFERTGENPGDYDALISVHPVGAHANQSSPSQQAAIVDGIYYSAVVDPDQASQRQWTQNNELEADSQGVVFDLMVNEFSRGNVTADTVEQVTAYQDGENKVYRFVMSQPAKDSILETITTQVRVNYEQMKQAADAGDQQAQAFIENMGDIDELVNSFAVAEYATTVRINKDGQLDLLMQESQIDANGEKYTSSKYGSKLAISNDKNVAETLSQVKTEIASQTH